MEDSQAPHGKMLLGNETRAMTHAGTEWHTKPGPDLNQTKYQFINMREMSFNTLSELAEGGYLYAIIDACDAPLVPSKIQELGELKARSLFKGSAQECYWAVAPYLAHLDASLLTWIRATLAHEPWGIFVLSKAGLETLHEHFRHFLIVMLHDSRQWFFRYYDPRVLTTYLPSCNLVELTHFFGPVRGYAVSAGNKVVVSEPAQRAAAAPSAHPAGFWYIRQEQYGVLDQLAIDNFGRRLTDHLLEFFPERCQEMGTDGINDLIRYCFVKTASYEIRVETDICIYLDLMMNFGVNFDSDPKCSWAADILRDPSDRNLQSKTSRLLERGIKVLEASEQQNA